MCDYKAYKNETLSKHKIIEHGIPNKINEKTLSTSLLAKHMYRNHDSLVPKPNHECDNTFLIKEVLAMHMHKEHNGVAPFQNSCDMCLFTSHLSGVLKNHINRKHLGLLKTFECNKYDFSAKS